MFNYKKKLLQKKEKENIKLRLAIAEEEKKVLEKKQKFLKDNEGMDDIIMELRKKELLQNKQFFDDYDAILEDKTSFI